MTVQNHTPGQRVHVRSRFDSNIISTGTVVGVGQFQTGLNGVYVQFDATGEAVLVNPTLITPGWNPPTRQHLARERRDRKRTLARRYMAQGDSHRLAVIKAGIVVAGEELKMYQHADTMSVPYHDRLALVEYYMARYHEAGKRVNEYLDRLNTYYGTNS